MVLAHGRFVGKLGGGEETVGGGINIPKWQPCFFAFLVAFP